MALTETALRSASIRWRVGLRGSLAVSLTISPIDGAVRGTVELVDGGDSGPVTIIDCSGQANSCDLETSLELVLQTASGAQATSITVLQPLGQPDRETTVLADLPAALGLRGGTYAIQHILIA